MHRSVHKLAFMPVLNPCCVLIVIIDGTCFLFKQGLVHFAFGGRDKCHVQTNRMRAEETVSSGICTVNETTEVLSLPKSNTHTAPLSPGV